MIKMKSTIQLMAKLLIINVFAGLINFSVNTLFKTVDKSTKFNLPLIS